MAQLKDLIVNGASRFIGDIAASGNIKVGGNIYASKVYNAVWNDYAELFKTFEPISPRHIAYQTKNGVKCTGKPKACIGVVSDSYGHLLGGEGNENDPNYVPIGLAGRVKLVVENIDNIEIGDFIAATDCGIGRKAVLPDDFGCVLGKCTNVFDNDIIEILITMT